MRRGRRGLIRRGLAGALAVLLAGPLPALADPAPAVTLTLPQARAVIRDAAARGDLALVRLLARGLEAGGAADGQVRFHLARAELQAGHGGAALDAARGAYRAAETDEQRFQSAQVAARAAHVSGRPTTAQLWLRRTYEHAGDDETRDAIARDYRVLRAINPLQFRLALGVQPSSNLNNGSGSRLNYIDGVPVVGVLSPTAQALSGVEYSADVALGYRLGALHKDRRITAVGRLYTRQVRLSDAARALAPMAENGDFAYTIAQAGVRGQFRAGPGAGYGLGLVAGQSWYGGDRYFHFARAEAEWDRRLDEATELGLSGYLEHRLYDGRPVTEDIAQIGLGLTRVLPGGSTLRARLTLQSSDLTGTTRDSRGASARLDWRPAEPLGPVSLSLGLMASFADHPDYQVGFIAVPGGRQDRALGAEMRLSLDRLDYAGFVPTLDLGVQRTRSNVSRFETEDVSLGLGIRSAF